MSDETTLLPCPFCGGEAHVVSDYSSEHDETRWSLWHECCEHDGESAGYGHALFPWFETPWYKTEAEAIAAWNTRAEHGTLTAEQVRKVVCRNSTYNDIYKVYQVSHADMQAIADELNATLGGGECSIEWRDESYDTDAGYERDGVYFCTACKADLPYPLQECWDDYQAGNGEKPFDCCPNCGKAVKR